MSLAAVNQICVIHGAMNGCKKSKDSLKACFENVNICELIRSFMQISRERRLRYLSIIFVIFIGPSAHEKNKDTLNPCLEI